MAVLLAMGPCSENFRSYLRVPHRKKIAGQWAELCLYSGWDLEEHVTFELIRSLEENGIFAINQGNAQRVADVACAVRQIAGSSFFCRGAVAS